MRLTAAWGLLFQETVAAEPRPRRGLNNILLGAWPLSSQLLLQAGAPEGLGRLRAKPRREGNEQLADQAGLV
jgi:hypothetical protein